jgi:formimidoylglutamase
MGRIKWCLIGIPDHEGVVRVGGRVGAAGGPSAFRRAFARLKGVEGVREALALETEAAALGTDVAANHRHAADVIRDAHRAHSLSVVVGGGHDHGYSHLLGILEALSKRGKGKPRLGCINIDPHFDVRKPEPEITSGSPYYLAIENGVIRPADLIEFGVQRHCNAPELWKYVERRKIPVVPFEKLRHGRAAAAFAKSLRQLAARCDAVVISLDLDAVAEAHAPGVSAPQAEGFDPTDVLEMMELAGREKSVASLGIFELNPEHDIGEMTARLGATAAWHFVGGRLA